MSGGLPPIEFPTVNPLGALAAVGVGLTLLWAAWPRRKPAKPAAPSEPKPDPTVLVAKGYPSPLELFDARTCSACRRVTWVPKTNASIPNVLCPECRQAATAPPPSPKAPTAPPAPETPPARRLTWRERRAKRRALSTAYADGAAASRHRRAAAREEAQRILTEADREEIHRRFADWDTRESEAIHEEMLDDLKPFYPDLSDEDLEIVAARLAKAPKFPVRGGSP